MHIKCTPAQADAFVAARSLSTYNRKAAKKRIFAEIRRQHPQARARKFVLFVADPSNPLYCVLRDKATKLPLDDGRPEPVQLAAPVAQAKAAPGVRAITKAVAKKAAPAKKAVVKAPAKKAVVKAPAKKAVVKAPAKKAVVKAPAKKAVVKAPAKKVAAKPAAKPAKAVSKAPAKAVKKVAPTKVAPKRK